MTSAFGESILAYWEGNSDAKHIIERGDGHKREIAVNYLFLEPSEWSTEEVHALEHIPPESTVLDIGCGVGRVATYLQSQGHKVVGLDACQEAIQIAKARGLQFTYLGNACRLENPPVFDRFDTIMMLGNNFGVCGDIPKTEDLLTRLNAFLASKGLLIFSCRDPLTTDVPAHLAYHQRNREQGRPPGLVRIRIVYQNLLDEWWDLLMVNIVTAEQILENTGYKKIAVYQEVGSPLYFFVAKKR